LQHLVKILLIKRVDLKGVDQGYAGLSPNVGLKKRPGFELPGATPVLTLRVGLLFYVCQDLRHFVQVPVENYLTLRDIRKEKQSDPNDYIWQGLVGETRVKGPGQLAGNPFQIEGCVVSLIF
jgi:hypothetical protein